MKACLEPYGYRGTVINSEFKERVLCPPLEVNQWPREDFQICVHNMWRHEPPSQEYFPWVPREPFQIEV
jgi:hypothetical protein